MNQNDFEEKGLHIRSVNNSKNVHSLKRRTNRMKDAL